jgi:8-oxo-dGTP pyrophosphatase MutT (NUDIX family)
MQSLSPTWQELAKQPLPREHYELVVGEDFYEHMHRNAGQRDGEVALAIRRPDGLILLHTKSSYPSGTWRIPTGGVEPGEAVGEAVRRELAEETGLPADGNRPLGVVTYELQTAGGRSLHFASAVFLVTVPDLPPAKQDPHEQISGYRWTLVHDLPAIAAQLEHLPSDWADWGHFRALAHRFVVRVHCHPLVTKGK